MNNKTTNKGIKEMNNKTEQEEYIDYYTEEPINNPKYIIKIYELSGSLDEEYGSNNLKKAKEAARQITYDGMGEDYVLIYKATDIDLLECLFNTYNKALAYAKMYEDEEEYDDEDEDEEEYDDEDEDEEEEDEYEDE